MNRRDRLSEAALPRGRRPDAGSALALTVAVGVWAVLAFGAMQLASSMALPWPVTLLLLGWLIAVALLGWAAWRQQALNAALRDARARLASLDELLDVWQWQSDVEHRVIQMRPPRGAVPAAWSLAVAGSGGRAGGALWGEFQVADAAALRRQLALGAPLDDIACERIAAGREPQPGRLNARARTDAAGAFCGYIGTFREAGPATEFAPGETAHLPAGRTALAMAPARDVPPAPAEIIATDSEHESFSYTVSHDLRAPIRVVEGFTKIVKEDYGRLLDRVGNDHLDRVLAAAARMNSMIDALLGLTKLSSQPLARQPVNLSQLAGYVVDDLRRQWPDRAVQVTIEPGLLVLGDPTLLRMLLENLLGNAWKYSAKTAEAAIWLERHAGEDDGFTVRDNGAGFDMRFAERLFGVFQRLHSASDFPGTGIGLASVQRIVRRHGGTIWAEADVGLGARFHFSLPQRAASGAVPRPTEAAIERRQR